MQRFRRIQIDAILHQQFKLNKGLFVAGLQSVMDSLYELHFVTCRFGLDAFPEWKSVFYPCLDLVVDLVSSESDKLNVCDGIVAKYLPDEQVLEPIHFSNPRLIFCFLLVQHLLPNLSAQFVQHTVMPLLQPHLTYKPNRTNDQLDLFEMGHWIYFKMFESMVTDDPWKFKQIVCLGCEEYTRLVLTNYLNGDSIDLVRRSLRAQVKALTRFSSAHDHEHVDTTDYNGITVNEERSSSTAAKTEVRSNQRGKNRSFGVKTVSRRQHKIQPDVTTNENATSKSWNPWEGDEIAWKFVIEKVIGLIRELTIKIDEAESGRPLDDGITLAQGTPSTSRLDEILEAAPGLRYYVLREGLVNILFDQIRTVGIPHLEKLLAIIRELVLVGVDVGNGKERKGLGVVDFKDLKEMSGSKFWQALFEAVSNDQYFDQMRQARCVEWYMELVRDARQLILREAANVKKDTTRSAVIPQGVLRAKL
ncbi:hypothetical protein BCR33DRAFT_212003 [Rhizoclosmatium globosum]|uniref:Uncharacterized protein n=1 Tax=Rhizoclosmatium globosum TaxID=329046 RepID=A0A1Y2CCY6_9FUNG|nr:hypothetical protein BCR33DRAFT_212003 [Rhizoclosmatium globosum]|eukprot:ORY44903.1 hypothetical protein BCR33DRAFT_212003 [Rhizoclosmatium globosum]